MRLLQQVLWFFFCDEVLIESRGLMTLAFISLEEKYFTRIYVMKFMKIVEVDGLGYSMYVFHRSRVRIPPPTLYFYIFLRVFGEHRGLFFHLKEK